MKKLISLMLALCIFIVLLSGCKMGDNTIPNAIARTQNFLGYTATSVITITSDFDFSNLPGIDEGSLEFIRAITTKPMVVTTRKTTNPEYTKGVIEMTISTNPEAGSIQTATFWLDYDFTSDKDDELKMTLIMEVPAFMTESTALASQQTRYFTFDFAKVPKYQKMLPAIKSLNIRRKVLHSLSPIDGFLAELRWDKKGGLTHTKFFDDYSLKVAILQMTNLSITANEIYSFLVYIGMTDLPSVEEAPGRFVSWVKPGFDTLPMLLEDGLLLDYSLSKNSFFSPNNQHIETENITFSFPIVQQTPDIPQIVPSVKVNVVTTIIDTKTPEFDAPDVANVSLDIRGQALTALEDIHYAVYRNAITPEPITILYEGQRIPFTAKNRPYVFNESTMVPATFFFKELGCALSTTKRENVDFLVIKRPGVEAEIGPDSMTAIVNGVEIELTSPTLIYEDRLYVPIRFVAEALDLAIQSDSSSGRIIIQLTQQ